MGWKDCWLGLGTHTPGAVEALDTHLSVLVQPTLAYIYSTPACAQAARPPLSLSQRKWAKKRPRVEPASIYKYMEAIKFALPQTCPKRQGRGIFPLENPSPVFLEKL